MKRFSTWANRNPLLAVWLGFVVCFVLMYCLAPQLIARVERPVHSSKGAV